MLIAIRFSSFTPRSFEPTPIFSRPLQMFPLFSGRTIFFSQPQIATPLLTRNFNYVPVFSPSFISLNSLLRNAELLNSRSFFAPRPQERSVSQEQLMRRAYGVAENEDLYGGIVQRENTRRHEAAKQNNQDGAAYIGDVIKNHISSLPNAEKNDFKKKIEEIDPELFIEIPRLAVKQALKSTVPLTNQNVPRFMHSHLNQLEELRKKQRSLNVQDVWKQSCDIATKLARETDCIAGMQKALETFST